MKVSIYPILATAAMAMQPAHAIDIAEGTDYSDLRGAPSVFVLDPGSNTLSGRTGTRGDGSVDRDYIALVVPQAYQLDALVLRPGTSVGGAYTFVGVQAGSQMTVDPAANSPAGLLGWAHFGSGDVGRDLLPNMAAGSGAVGFSGPLASGTYTFWVQDFADATYDFGLVVSAVPEASGLATLLAGLGVLGIFRRRHRA